MNKLMTCGTKPPTHPTHQEETCLIFKDSPGNFFFINQYCLYRPKVQCLRPFIFQSVSQYIFDGVFIFCQVTIGLMKNEWPCTLECARKNNGLINEPHKICSPLSCRGQQAETQQIKKDEEDQFSRNWKAKEAWEKSKAHFQLQMLVSFLSLKLRANRKNNMSPFFHLLFYLVFP